MKSPLTRVRFQWPDKSRYVVRSPGGWSGYFLRGTKRYAHKMPGNAILCRSLFKKRFSRCVVLQVSIQKLQRVERHPGIVRVGVLSSVIGDLVFRKALRTFSALKHGTELRVCHANHIHGEKIAACPRV